MDSESIRLSDWLLLIGVIVLVLGGVGVIAAYFLLRRSPKGKLQRAGLSLGALGLVLVIVSALLAWLNT